MTHQTTAARAIAPSLPAAAEAHAKRGEDHSAIRVVMRITGASVAEAKMLVAAWRERRAAQIGGRVR